MSDHKHTPEAEVLKSLDRRAYRHATGQASEIALTQLEARTLLDIGANRRRLRDALAEWLDADDPVAGVTYTSRGGFGRGQEELDAERAQHERLREAKRKARAALALDDGQEEA